MYLTIWGLTSQLHSRVWYQPDTGAMQPNLIEYHLSDWQEMKKRTHAIKIWNISISGKNFQKVLVLINGTGSQKYYDVLDVRATRQYASCKELKWWYFVCLAKRFRVTCPVGSKLGRLVWGFPLCLVNGFALSHF